MALGKNMKVDRLIPLEVENISENEDISATIDLSEKTEVQEETIVESQPEVESDSEVKSEPAIQYENIVNETLKMTFVPSRRKTQKRILINIEGVMNINNVDLLYSKVNVVFENYDFVEVTMTNITDIDLTVIQLFHAIRVAYLPQQKYITINSEFSRDDRKLLNICGFVELQSQKTD
jgi:hypothetical protein